MIGSVGPNLPHDVLAATGRFSGPLTVDVDRETPRADQWLESKFAPWARALVEGWAHGQMDHLEAVVFSRADDSSQRLYYYLCELQRRGLIGGPEPLIFDISKIPRASSIARTEDAVRGLCARFHVSNAALEEAIRQTNHQRSSRAGPPNGKRCLITGTPLPDRRLHQVIEHSGFVAWGETLADEWGNLGDIVPESGVDPIAALGAQLHAAQMGPRSFSDPAAMLTKQAAELDAKAIILWRIEEDEAQAWHLPAQRRALAEGGIPSLILTRRDWRARDGVADEIRAFLAEIAA